MYQRPNLPPDFRSRFISGSRQRNVDDTRDMHLWASIQKDKIQADYITRMREIQMQEMGIAVKAIATIITTTIVAFVSVTWAVLKYVNF